MVCLNPSMTGTVKKGFGRWRLHPESHSGSQPLWDSRQKEEAD